MTALADKYLIGIYEDLEREVITDIARRVNKTKRYTETAELQADALRKQGFTPAQIQQQVMQALNANIAYQQEVAANTLEYKAMVMQAIQDTEAKALAAGDMLTANAGDMSYRDDLRAWHYPPEDLTMPNPVRQIVAAVQAQTRGAIRGITQTTGFKNTPLGTTGVLNAYNRVLDLATMKVASGAFSYDTAVRDIVSTLAKSGLRSIDYSTGRSYELDTAARMCVRTALGQLSGQIQQENMKQVDTPLVYVDAHAGARPEHAVWQGKVYAYNPNGLLPNGQLAGSKYGDFFSETDYGSPTGLLGINCAHNFYPYWEGDAIPEFKEPGPFDVGGKTYTYYEATQEMRKQERDIRAQKRKIEALAAAGNDTKQEKAKLAAMRSKYYGFSKQVDINPRRSALGVQTSKMPKGPTPAPQNATTPGKTTGAQKTISRNKSQEIERNKPTPKRYPTSQKEIDDIQKNELKNVRFSNEIVYNSHIRTPGKTTCEESPFGTRKITKIEIGIQSNPGRSEVIDTMLHEELEARILIKATKSEFYKNIENSGNSGIHEYINKVIDTAFRIKGWER